MVVADQREVEAERDVRPFPQQHDRVCRARAGRHQTARCRDAVLDRIDDRRVHRLVHAEVVAVEDQYAGVGREAEKL